MPEANTSASSQEQRFNVLVIVTDQHRADHLGFMGNHVVRTPNLDRLAADSLVFENAWVSNPVCMPNRSTIVTGRMPSAHGVIFNDRSLEWGANTFARQFKAAGYRTGLLGKSHLQVDPCQGKHDRCQLAVAHEPGVDHLAGSGGLLARRLLPAHALSPLSRMP